MSDSPVSIHQLGADDVELMHGMLALFGEAFAEPETYTANPPQDSYLRKLLDSRNFIALAALDGGEVIGAIAAYDLMKFEQARSEIYIYDLAVAAAQRRRGIATAMIEYLQQLAAERAAHVVFVQADTGIEDEPAIALYSKLGQREDVLHFDIPVAADARRTAKRGKPA